MTKSSDTILESANSWIENHQKVALATVIETWGSSPCQIGSKMIINEKGEFLGSVSGGCVEANVINECLELMKNKNLFKKIHYTVKDDSAWSVGLACGGELTVFIEQIN
jgi:xanthine/CO dehydrogenase XdhC/CoxF family maturation factor|tara:strand:+ start:856 stop:1182 length:327 start_codon:yes stop_codon:yes gene_type:complete